MAPLFLRLCDMAADRGGIKGAKVLMDLGAETAQALTSASPEAIALLDQYTEAFEKWQKSWARSSSSELSSVDRSLLERVAKQHAKIIELAEQMLTSVEHSLKDLKGWSKGIRAYVDHMPKRVSTMKARKG
jgi:hypothetical protein